MIRLLITSMLFSFPVFSFTLVGFQKGWNTKTLSININPTNCPSDIIDRLNDSFKLWNSVSTSSLKLNLGSTTSTTTAAQLNGLVATDIPVVICDSQFTTNQSADGNSVAGVGFGTGTNYSGNITYGGLTLNVEPGKSGNIHNMTDIQRNIVVAHEIGHMLGLGHSSSNPALMYFSIGGKQDFNLSKDDWDGLSYLYPRDEVGQTNLAAGCGTIKKSIPPSTRNLIIILMLLPFLVYLIGRLNCWKRPRDNHRQN